MKRSLFLIAVLVAVAITASAQSFSVGSVTEEFSLPDTSGKVHTLASLKGTNGTVLMFLSAQCPVVKQYNDRINEIAAAYATKGITFIGINSNATESIEWVTSHATANYKFPMLIDKGNKLADKLGASVTPEAYFLDAKNVLVYHGAIDNDKSGQNITDTYLKTAFDASLGGKKVERNRALAVGCSIKRVAE